MTTSLALRWPAGLIAPSRSTAQSDSALQLDKMAEQTRSHLLKSYTVRQGIEGALEELEETRKEASFQGWNGYGADPIETGAYLCAKLFLESMPSTAPVPEISADPDGDVALDWFFGDRRILSVSISPTGRCSFAWILGQRTYRGTEWFNDGIPESIANALSRLARESIPTPYTR